jgi:hypothetical protein
MFYAGELRLIGLPVDIRNRHAENINGQVKIYRPVAFRVEVNDKAQKNYLQHPQTGKD